MAVCRRASGNLEPALGLCPIERRRLRWEHQIDPVDADGVTRVAARGRGWWKRGRRVGEARQAVSTHARARLSRATFSLPEALPGLRPPPSSLAHAFWADRNAGACGSIQLGMTLGPAGLGSGKLGTPCERMHCASLSGDPPLATTLLDLGEDPHATTANAKPAAASATRGLCRSAFNASSARQTRSPYRATHNSHVTRKDGAITGSDRQASPRSTKSSLRLAVRLPHHQRRRPDYCLGWPPDRSETQIAGAMKARRGAGSWTRIAQVVSRLHHRRPPGRVPGQSPVSGELGGASASAPNDKRCLIVS